MVNVTFLDELSQLAEQLLADAATLVATVDAIKDAALREQTIREEAWLQTTTDSDWPSFDLLEPT